LLKSGRPDLATEQFQRALDDLIEFDCASGKAVFESEIEQLRELIKLSDPAAAD
jgi:hypothetical protein